MLLIKFGLRKVRTSLIMENFVEKIIEMVKKETEKGIIQTLVEMVVIT